MWRSLFCQSRARFVVTLFLTGCGQGTRNDLEQPQATTASGTANATASATSGQGGSTDTMATADTVSTVGASVGGASSSGDSTDGLAGGGTSGGTGTQTSSAGGTQASSVDVSGNWAMFIFEDPVAVSLQQRGAELQGMGCCGGLNTGIDFCCGPIAGGSIDGRHVQFGFPVGVGSWVYMADVFVSEDGERMAGPFHHLGGWGPPTAWVRIADGEAWLPLANAGLSEQLAPYSGAFTLVLNDTEAVGTFVPNTDYELALIADNGAFIFGDLGSFWEGELSWDEATETLQAGPVPQTHPDLPIELRLSFAGTEPLDLVAQLPSGEAATFSLSR